jgi:hypothetical protein
MQLHLLRTSKSNKLAAVHGASNTDLLILSTFGFCPLLLPAPPLWLLLLFCLHIHKRDKHKPRYWW